MDLIGKWPLMYFAIKSELKNPYFRTSLIIMSPMYHHTVQFLLILYFYVFYKMILRIQYFSLFSTPYKTFKKSMWQQQENCTTLSHKVQQYMYVILKRHNLPLENIMYTTFYAIVQCNDFTESAENGRETLVDYFNGRAQGLFRMSGVLEISTIGPHFSM